MHRKINTLIAIMIIDIALDDKCKDFRGFSNSQGHIFDFTATYHIDNQQE